MLLKVHNFFVLLGLFALVRGQAVNLTCTREMVESYGVISNDQAKKERLVMCPQIQFSCCPAYEQFKMFKTYSETAKPSFILLNEVIKKELALLEVEVIKLVNSGVIDQKIQSISDKAIQMRVQYTWNKIKNQRPQAIFQKLQKYQKVSSSYVAAWKSAFFCTICDFANQNFIDIQNKKITYSAASCDALVFNTLLFTNLLNSVLIPYLSSLTEIITRLKGNGKYQKLHNIRRVNKAIKDCANDYKQYDSGLGNCKAYCEYFNPVQDNYVLEGYPEFFANTLVEIRLFSGGGGGSSGSSSSSSAAPRSLIEQSVRDLIRKTKAKNRRLREKIENDSYFQVSLPKSSKFKGFKSMRILEEKDELAELENVHEEHLKLQNRRILQENGDWSQDLLDPNNNVTKIIDIFDREASDPEFDDAMVNQMMEVQDIFNTGDPALYAQMIRKYYVDNFSADLDDIDSENLFKETTLARVDYTQFQTIFSFAGIDIHRIVDKMNWSLAFKQIGVSLTATSNEESEMIFPDVVQAINAVSNNDVRDFYRNQFVRFRKPNYNLFSETMNGLLSNFAISKLRHIIAENMAVYNYLVRTMNQDNADKIWAQIEMIRSQLKGLTMNAQNFTVVMYNQTMPGNVTVQSINITSGVNASGFANVTTIQDVKSLQSSYKTTTQLVSENQQAGYNEFIAQANATANATSNSGTSNTAAPKRSLMGDKRKHKLKK